MKQETDHFIARTGRVQDWVDNQEDRLPVSCTVFVVEDSCEGPDGIEASWRFCSHALRNGAGVAVHLSNLRARGSENGRGLTASGPVSFGKIYSVLNEILRRGGVFKNGATVLHLDICHEDIIEFCDASRTELPWAKKCVDLTPAMWNDSTQETKDSVIAGIKRGDIWLSKIKHDNSGERIYSNVCLEVYLKSRGTCLLEHVNLGICTVDKIPEAFKAAMTDLVKLHPSTGVNSTNEYLPTTVDKQVGLGMLGLANLLALEEVTYLEFAEALECFSNPKLALEIVPSLKATRIVEALDTGITEAAHIARYHSMERAFAIAPTASCSYRYKDRAGYTTAPEIAPPIGRVVDRDSSTFGVSQHDYGSVQTAEEVGWDNYFRVANGIMGMLQDTGLCHGYSFNSWSDVVIYNEEFIQDWLKSPQTSLYYSLQVMQNTQAKDDILNALDDSFRDLFDFDDLPDDLDVIPNLSEYNDPSICVGCAE